MTEQTSNEFTSDDAERIHANSIVVNGLAQPGHLPIALDAMLDGGITVTNLTVAANENFAEGVRKFEDALQAIEDHPRSHLLSVTRTADDISRVHREGGAGVMIGFQNADPIEDNLDYLSIFYRLGLRVLQLTYQRRNLLGDGNGEPGDAGLSIFGHQVIEECNRLGTLSICPTSGTDQRWRRSRLRRSRSCSVTRTSTRSIRFHGTRPTTRSRRSLHAVE